MSKDGPADWDTPRPTERRITIGAKPALSDYELVRLALETLGDKLRIQSRNEQNQLCITYLVPSQAEEAYTHALNILLRTPPVTKL